MEQTQQTVVSDDIVTANQRTALVSPAQSEASILLTDQSEASTVLVNQSENQEDVMTGVVRRQEAALRRLEAKHGSGYGKPPPGSESEARAKRYNENCMR